MGEDFEKVKLRGGVVLGKIVGFEGTNKLLGEYFVFGYVFGYLVGVSSCFGFRANAPGVGGMVTQVLDIEFSGVIMDSGLMGARRVNGRGG